MAPALQSRFDALENLRIRLEEAEIGLNDEQGRWKPNPAAWSHREIVEHLVLSDEIVGKPAEKVGSEPWPLRIVPRALRRALIAAAFQRDIPLPLPDPALAPRGETPIAELIDRWRRSREAMREDLGSPEIGNLRYAHPILGPMTAVQMLDLGVAHTGYHVRQADALRQLSGFPANG